jgi:hypothetical protein
MTQIVGLPEDTENQNIWILATPISSVGPSILSVTFDIEDFNIECSFNIDVLHLLYRCRYRRCSISKVTLFDIECDKPSISKVMNGVVDIEVSCLRIGFDVDHTLNHIAS